MKKILISILFFVLSLPSVLAQQAALSKLSPMLRRYVLEQRMQRRQARSLQASPITTAFVRIQGDGEQILRQNGCRPWAHWGNIYVASIPMNRIATLSMLPEVTRMEANQSQQCTMDSAVIQINALPAYEGRQLPQAFTGKGVVMGIMDIGFDLTHPNFYNYQMSDYRIKALWDMLSTDTLQSTLPVGRDFLGKEALLGIGCSTDGHDQTHGTHTAGIAAGSGGEGLPMAVPGKYHGVAYESDLCLVANATSDNQALIDPKLLDRFTYAMDALGFKYIFDYADRVGKPCVISFSEGAGQDFAGYDILYNEVLDSLTSVPGHIIVSSAGNNGLLPYYIHKPVGKESAGCFVNNWKMYAYHTAKSAQPFTLRTIIYEGKSNPHTFDVATEKVLRSPDSTYIDTLQVAGKEYFITIGAYPSCYNDKEICYDWMVKCTDEPLIGTSNYLAYQVMGSEADVEVYHGSGNMFASDVDPSLCDAECSHSINSPACSESVVCVGSTINHTYSIDLEGNKQNIETEPSGSWVKTSSIGPTFDGRIKPDVVAPGNNVVASYSSYYEQYHPDARDILHSDVAHFQYQGRTYAWNNNGGTSMASPVVGGAVALWLEANPKLTRRDVMDIISKTSHRLDDQHDVPNNYWGYGEIDVYRGLLAALQVDGIQAISSCQPQKAHIGIDGNEVVIGMDAQTISYLANKTQHSFSVSIYNTAGVKLRSERFEVGAAEYRMDISDLPAGIYIVQVDGDSSIKGSSVIRHASFSQH